jgi:hypothetical protein
VRYRVTVARLEGILAVTLRYGTSEATGEPVTSLFGPRHVRGVTTGLLVEGTITAADVVGPLAGPAALEALVAAMNQQRVYVEVDTTTFPRGEVRGQVHSDRRRPTDL